MSTSEISTQSPKKRKAIDGETLTASKKKRKHAEKKVQEQETPQLPITNVKEKKRKSRSKITDTDKKAESPSVQPVEDIELVDAPEISNPEEHTPVSFEQHEVLTNGNLEPDLVEEVDESVLASDDPSCFYTKRLSLYVPVPAISLSTSTASLLSLHLTPLLLTYFPPAKGIILAFSDPVLSAKSQNGVNLPLKPPTSRNIASSSDDETFAQCADQFGVSWLWLTATFLVFAPERGDMLKAWANIQSESFIGLISYNYFQTSVMKTRIPKKWTFKGPSREQRSAQRGRKGKLQGQNAEDMANDTTDAIQSTKPADNNSIDVLDGVFLDAKGKQISQSQAIRVNDIDMTPGAERTKYGLQIDGSLLTLEEETAVLEEERRLYEASRKRKTKTLEDDTDTMGDITMSGAL